MNATVDVNIMARAEVQALYEQCKTQGGVFEVEDATILRVRGEDRLRFLNGQLTNDILKLQPGEAKPACCLDAKGKLCALVKVRMWDEGHVLLDATSDFRTSLPERLQRYIIADDVEIDDLSDDFFILHVFGLGQERCELSQVGGRSAKASRIGISGTDWIVPKSSREDTARLIEGVPHPAPTILEALRVEHGVPKWGAELDEMILPPEAGLETQAISYDKGCYIGQEVISRIRSVGHPSKRLTGFLVDDLRQPHMPLPREAPLQITDETGLAAGRLTSLVWSFALDRHIALGYLKWQAKGNVFQVSDAESSFACRLTRHTLPFVSSQ